MKSVRKPLPRMLGCLLAAAAALTPLPGFADERESLEVLRETTLNLIDALVEQGVFTREKADAMVKAAENKAKAAAKTRVAAPATQRVQYVPETVKNEIREQLKQEVLAQARTERWAEPNSIPSWLDSIKWEGDLRVRYQVDDFARDNATALTYGVRAAGGTTRAASLFDTTTVLGMPNANATEKTERYRVRARLGMLARISDEWGAAIRLATGSTTDRVSTNQTLGQDWNKYTLTVDRAFVKYDPWEWLSASAGRIPNPWFSTDLLWDDDLNFEGIAATVKPAVANGTVKPFLTAGAFPIKAESNPVTHGRWMHGIQGGAQWDITSTTRLKVGAAMYGFRDFEGRVESDATWFALGSSYGQYEYNRGLRQKGNTLFRTNAPSDATATIWGLASRFRPINVTASLDLAQFDPFHLVLTGDWVRNTAYDRAEIASRTQGRATLTDGKNTGYLYKLTLGMPALKNARDWQVSFAYRYLGSDAVLDAFTDSDFGLGGTNLKGYSLGVQYGLDRNAVLGLRWMSAQSIDSFSLNPADRFAVDVLQADVSVRF